MGIAIKTEWIEAFGCEKFFGPPGNIARDNTGTIKFILYALATPSLRDTRSNKNGSITNIVDQTAIKGALHRRLGDIAGKAIAHKTLDKLTRTAFPRAGKTLDLFKRPLFVFGASVHDGLKNKRGVLETRESMRGWFLTGLRSNVGHGVAARIAALRLARGVAFNLQVVCICL